jgi:dihydrofolate reductase
MPVARRIVTTSRVGMCGPPDRRSSRKPAEDAMRNLIAAMKVSLDAKAQGPEGIADWVEAWSEDFDLTPQIDACLLGGGMYPGYETYWTAIRTQPDTPAWITGEPPTSGEQEWARLTETTPHYVLSSTLQSATWPNTSFLRSIEAVAALKQQPGKDIYLIGGAHITSSMIDAGLVDELRLITYPLIAGSGSDALFGAAQRRGLGLRTVRQLDGGKVASTYRINP